MNKKMPVLFLAHGSPMNVVLDNEYTNSLIKLGKELEKPTTPSLEAFWDLRQNFFACFLSFFWLGSLWMALNTLWEKVEKISSEIIWWNLFLLLERQEFSLENFMPSKIPV